MSWHPVGDTNDIPALGSRVVETRIGRIALFRTSDERYFAVADSCPHKQGPLSQGIVHGTKVTCPLHELVIDLETGEAVAPDTGCARVFALNIDDGKISVELPDD